MEKLTIKLSDLLFIIAEATVKMGEKAGKPVNIVQLYQDDDCVKGLAVAGGLVRQMVEKNTGTQIEVITD